MIKKVFLLALIVALTNCVSAQKKRPWVTPLYDGEPYHFGFAFSLGKMGFVVDHSDNFNALDTVYAIEYSGGALFGASMIFNLKLADNLDLRTQPGLLFAQRNLNYFLRDDKIPADKQLHKHDMKIESTLLQFPTSIKYRAIRESNYRPYLFCGLNPAIDLAARKKVAEEEKPKIKLKKFDVYAELGFGLDNYFTWFKYSTEIKFSFGLLDMVNRDNTEYTQAFNRLGSKMITLVLCFE